MWCGEPSFHRHRREEGLRTGKHPLGGFEEPIEEMSSGPPWPNGLTVSRVRRTLIAHVENAPASALLIPPSRGTPELGGKVRHDDISSLRFEDSLSHHNGTAGSLNSGSRSRLKPTGQPRPCQDESPSQPVRSTTGDHSSEGGPVPQPPPAGSSTTPRAFSSPPHPYPLPPAGERALRRALVRQPARGLSRTMA